MVKNRHQQNTNENWNHIDKTYSNYAHPKLAIERISIQTDRGGRGFIILNSLWQEQINNLRTLFFEKAKITGIHSARTEIEDFTPLNLKARLIGVNTKTDLQKK